MMEGQTNGESVVTIQNQKRWIIEKMTVDTVWFAFLVYT